MENARRFIPTPSEFKKPASKRAQRKRDHLQVVDTDFVVPATDIATAPTLEAKAFINKQERTPLPVTAESVESVSDTTDLQLEKLITWPPHPKLKLAQELMLQIDVDESNLHSLEQYDDPEYQPNNRPDEDKLQAEKERLQEKIESSKGALELIIEPALQEAEAITAFAENTRSTLLHFKSDEPGKHGFEVNPNVDERLRARHASNLRKDNRTREGQIGKRTDYFLEEEIDSMASQINQLKTFAQKKYQPQKLQPVRPITQPNLKLVPNPEPEPNLGNKISGFFKKITGIFRKAA